MSANLLTILAIAGALVIIALLAKIVSLLVGIDHKLHEIAFYTKRIPINLSQL
jgi:hypothetical protein